MSEDWYGRGCELMGRGQWGTAAGCFARCVEGEPGQFRAWANLGWCRHLAGRSGEGLEDLLRALELAPGEGQARALVSQVALLYGEAGSAVEHAGLAVAAGPREPDHHLALAFALMRGGEWSEGWLEYEWRFFGRIPEFAGRPYRLWRGERVEHLFVEAEQGIGDTIFALRWLPFVAERVGRITLFVHHQVYSLVADQAQIPSLSVFPMPRPFPDGVDAWCPMMSLPAALEMGDPFCPEHGYIELSALRQAREDYWSAKTPEAERDAYARARASGQPPSFGEGFGGKVAICWSGDPKHENAAHRDCPLGEFLRLAEVPGVRLHSVQVGPGAARFGELGCWGLVEDRGPEITNFADTARILGEMDLVVTVDTSVGHLAGAMGIPTWLLVNRRGQDFRLGMEGETTEWYPGHRLFRRDVGEGWDAVMGRAVDALRELMR